MTLRTGGSGPVMLGGRVVAGAPVAAGKLREALTLAHRLCAPLGYLHQLGIVHRDLKPGNVFVRPDGRPVLMDFGLVSRFGAAGRDVLEIAGTLAGTAAYMAPEQILRQRVDARTRPLRVRLHPLRIADRASSVSGRLDRRHSPEAPDRASAPAVGDRHRRSAALDELLLSLLAKTVRERIGHADDVAASLAELGAEVEAARAAAGSRLRPGVPLSSRAGGPDRRARVARLAYPHAARRRRRMRAARRRKRRGQDLGGRGAGANGDAAAARGGGR